MSKQIYIDSNGNEIQVSGTVNTADMLPLEAGSSKMTSEAIGDLSTLTTTDKSSLVGAVNEVNSTKANASDFEGCKMKGFVIAGGATVTVTGSTGIIVASANNNDATAGAYAFSNMGGSFRLKTLASGSGVTITATRTDGVITFTNGGASYIQGVIVYA